MLSTNHISNYISNNLNIKQINHLSLIKFNYFTPYLKQYIPDNFYLSHQFNNIFETILTIIDDKFIYYNKNERINSFKLFLLKNVKFNKTKIYKIINNKLKNIDMLLQFISNFFNINIILFTSDKHKIFYSLHNNIQTPFIIIYIINDKYYSIDNDSDKIYLHKKYNFLNKIIKNFVNIDMKKYNKTKIKELKKIALDKNIIITKLSKKTKKQINKSKMELYIDIYHTQ